MLEARMTDSKLQRDIVEEFEFDRRFDAGNIGVARGPH